MTWQQDETRLLLKARDRIDKRLAQLRSSRLRRQKARLWLSCHGCGKRFEASRIDAITCSPACRTFRYRLRQG